MEADKNPGHQPERFAEYEEAKDGSGFFLSNGEFYRYEKDGGFFDKFGNYYNAEGQPGPIPDRDEDYESVSDEEEIQKNPEIADPRKKIENEIEVMVDEYENDIDSGEEQNDDDPYEKVYEQNLRIQKRKKILREEIFNLKEKDIEFLVKWKKGDVNNLKTHINNGSKNQCEI